MSGAQYDDNIDDGQIITKTFQVDVNALHTRLGALLISLRAVSLTRRIIRSAARVHTL